MSHRANLPDKMEDDADLASFLSETAHDLRGALNTLVLTVELLDGSWANPDETKATLGVIRESVADLARVVGRLEARAGKLAR